MIRTNKTNGLLATRTSLAQATKISPRDLGHNLGLDFKHKRQSTGSLGELLDDYWTGFNVRKGTLQARAQGYPVEIEGVLIEEDCDVGNFKEDQPAEGINEFYIAASRVTDTLVLAPTEMNQYLDVVNANGHSSQSPLKTAFRAGALSACFMIIFEAARRLDVDPDEFEVLEPRVFFDGSVNARSYKFVTD